MRKGRRRDGQTGASRRRLSPEEHFLRQFIYFGEIKHLPVCSPHKSPSQFYWLVSAAVSLFALCVCVCVLLQHAACPRPPALHICSQGLICLIIIFSLPPPLNKLRCRQIFSLAERRRRPPKLSPLTWIHLPAAYKFIRVSPDGHLVTFQSTSEEILPHFQPFISFSLLMLVPLIGVEGAGW